MSYIGNPIISTDFPKDTFSGNGSTTAFTMSIAPASVNAVLVIVSGITQAPATYTISGTTLTFSGAPPTGTDNIIVRHLGVAGIPNTPSAGSVTTASLASGNLFSQWATSGSDINYTAGSVGIGATPTQKLDVYGSDNNNLIISRNSNGTSSLRFQSNAAAGYIVSTGAIPLILDANGSEKMRINSGGAIGINTTRATARLCIDAGIESTFTALSMKDTDASTGGTFVAFTNSSNDSCGSITHNGTTTIAYNSSSDYRMKENVVRMTGALAKVQLLKPVTYKWKERFGGEDGQGFIAHELQAVVPDCVTGEKDAVKTVNEVDEEGNVIGTKEVPEYQSIDTSFLVATLTAAIQEQQAMIQTQQAAIEALTTRVTALEIN